MDCTWLFFVADLQTGFGPFIAVYLTAHGWTQADLGIALGVGSASAMLAQVPAGALVDVLRSKASASAIALVGICASAGLMAWSSAFWWYCWPRRCTASPAACSARRSPR